MTRPSLGWSRRVPVRALSLLVSVALLVAGFAIFARRIQWEEMVRIWSQFHLVWLLMALVFYWLQYPLASWRQFIIIDWLTGLRANGLLRFPLIFRLTGAAGFIAAAAPIGLMGDIAKILGLRALTRLSLTDATRCAFFDRVVGIQWMAVLGLVSLPLQLTTDVAPSVIIAQVALFAGIAVGVVAVLIMPRLLGLLGNKLVDRIAQLFVGYGAMLIPARSATQLVIATLNLASAGATLYALTVAAGVSTNPWLVVAFIPLLQFINSLPFLYFGWGGREIALVATLGSAGGMSVNEALSISAAWGTVLMVAGVVNGLFLIGPWKLKTMNTEVRRD